MTTKFYNLSAYANGNVTSRRYYGDNPDAAAKRYAAKHGAKVASVEAVSYYGTVTDRYYVEA